MPLGGKRRIAGSVVDLEPRWEAREARRDDVSVAMLDANATLELKPHNASPVGAHW